MAGVVGVIVTRTPGAIVQLLVIVRYTDKESSPHATLSITYSV